MNNNKKLAWIIILVIVLLVSAMITFPIVLAYSGYKNFQENQETNSGILGEPEEIVENFYSGYLAYDGNPLVDKQYQSKDMLTDSFITYLDEFTANLMMYDPILCAQDRPERVVTGKAEISDGTATVPMLSNFADHSFTVELHQVGGLWKINMIVCNTD
jgi:hypothetical protein